MQLADLCLSARDKKLLAGYSSDPTHGILLVADAGFGKLATARALADKITSNREYNQMIVSELEDSKSITIEQARQIKKFFRLRSNSKTEKRVIVIENADKMTIEAQNALLKILEEPPENCYLILTATHPSRLLPTVTSRVQTHVLRPVTRAELSTYAKSQGYTGADVDKALNLVGQLPGVALSILRGENTDIVDSVKQAKETLGLSTVERLKTVDKLSKDKQATEMRLNGLKIVANAALVSSIENGKDPTKWAELLRTVVLSLKQLEQNASAKLVLTNLFLSL